jgi:hypothetical protein
MVSPSELIGSWQGTILWLLVESCHVIALIPAFPRVLLISQIGTLTSRFERLLNIWCVFAL